MKPVTATSMIFIRAQSDERHPEFPQSDFSLPPDGVPSGRRVVSASMKSNSPITHEEITQRAHDIWEQSGRPAGQETEHWFRAEQELRKERGQVEQFSKGDMGSQGNRKMRM